MQNDYCEKYGKIRFQNQPGYKLVIPGMKEFFDLLPEGIHSKIPDDDLIRLVLFLIGISVLSSVLMKIFGPVIFGALFGLFIGYIVHLQKGRIETVHFIFLVIGGALLCPLVGGLIFSLAMSAALMYMLNYS